MRHKEAQPKNEHPMTKEWDEIKRRADEQGLLHRDGTFAFPPDGGCSISRNPLLNRPVNHRLEVRYLT